MKIESQISPKFFVKILLLIILFLIIGHLLYLISKFFYGYSYQNYLRLFYLDDESNIPSLYSTVALFIVSLLLFIVGYLRMKLYQVNYFYWFFLSIIFLLMSYDEAASLHEYLNEIFWGRFPELPVYLGFGWVIPYFILTALVGILSIKFLLSLPRRTAILFVKAGAFFIIGAMGMEFIGAYLWANAGGQESLLYNLVATIEELLEMLGIVLFIYAILDYISKEFGDLVIIQFKRSAKVDL